MRNTCWLLFVAVLVCGGALLWWVFMTTHYPVEGFYVARSMIPDKDALGGFSKRGNYPRDLAGQDWGKAGTVSLIAFPDERASWRNLRGFAVRLVNRTDKPVADGTVKRGFYWGPTPGADKQEAYEQGTGGARLVQYFDKSRMEINNPSGDKTSRI